ncbi:MAG TPA: glutathione S-transferase N-terminal domain-containing protein [Solirubrobacteraceae bacterium]|nr:glutathione S-transferase N-terminal domain-containing protein [Solirubrobacteraceae bacterium]
MKLYVCWGTFPTPRPGGHPCANAYHALKDAGHDFELVKSYGLGVLPDALNNTSGRKRAKELTGKNWVPVLELDDGSAIFDSREIVKWAAANPA